MEFERAFSPFIGNELQTRVEGSYARIFCNDKKLVKKLCKALGKWAETLYEPASKEECSYLLDNGRRKQVCDEFPKGKYRYKVYFKSGLDRDTRASFAGWIGKYKEDKLLPSAATKRWFLGDLYYLQMPFMYVTDEQTLAMVGMYLGNNIKCVDEFILRNSINTRIE
jgi:hypothetical protein